MKKRSKEQKYFCPVPSCVGIMEKVVRTEETGNKEEFTYSWVCPLCGFEYKGSKPMDIWEAVAKKRSEEDT